MEPLGIKDPILAAKPLGQDLLSPQFIMPVAAQPLTAIAPEVFFPKGIPGYIPPENSFADSPFFSQSRTSLSRQSVNPILSESTPNFASQPTIQRWIEPGELLQRQLDSADVIAPETTETTVAETIEPSVPSETVFNANLPDTSSFNIQRSTSEVQLPTSQINDIAKSTNFIIQPRQDITESILDSGLESESQSVNIQTQLESSINDYQLSDNPKPNIQKQAEISNQSPPVETPAPVASNPGGNSTTNDTNITSVTSSPSPDVPANDSIPPDLTTIQRSEVSPAPPEISPANFQTDISPSPVEPSSIISPKLESTASAIASEANVTSSNLESTDFNNENPTLLSTQHSAIRETSPQIPTLIQRAVNSQETTTPEISSPESEIGETSAEDNPVIQRAVNSQDITTSEVSSPESELPKTPEVSSIVQRAVNSQATTTPETSSLESEIGETSPENHPVVQRAVESSETEMSVPESGTPQIMPEISSVVQRAVESSETTTPEISSPEAAISETSSRNNPVVQRAVESSETTTPETSSLESEIGETFPENNPVVQRAVESSETEMSVPESGTPQIMPEISSVVQRAVKSPETAIPEIPSSEAAVSETSSRNNPVVQRAVGSSEIAIPEVSVPESETPQITPEISSIVQRAVESPEITNSEIATPESAIAETRSEENSIAQSLTPSQESAPPQDSSVVQRAVETPEITTSEISTPESAITETISQVSPVIQRAVETPEKAISENGSSGSALAHNLTQESAISETASTVAEPQDAFAIQRFVETSETRTNSEEESNNVSETPVLPDSSSESPVTIQPKLIDAASTSVDSSPLTASKANAPIQRLPEVENNALPTISENSTPTEVSVESEESFSPEVFSNVSQTTGSHQAPEMPPVNQPIVQRLVESAGSEPEISVTSETTAKITSHEQSSGENVATESTEENAITSPNDSAPAIQPARLTSAALPPSDITDSPISQVETAITQPSLKNTESNSPQPLATEKETTSTSPDLNAASLGEIYANEAVIQKQDLAVDPVTEVFPQASISTEETEIQRMTSPTAEETLAQPSTETASSNAPTVPTFPADRLEATTTPGIASEPVIQPLEENDESVITPSDATTETASNTLPSTAIQRQSAATANPTPTIPQLPRVLRNLVEHNPTVPLHQPLVQASQFLTPGSTNSTTSKQPTSIQRQLETHSHQAAAEIPNVPPAIQTSETITPQPFPNIARRTSTTDSQSFSSNIPDSWSNLAELLDETSDSQTNSTVIQPFSLGQSSTRASSSASSSNSFDELTDWFSDSSDSSTESSSNNNYSNLSLLDPENSLNSNVSDGTSTLDLGTPEQTLEETNQTHQNQASPANQEDNNQLETLAREIYQLLRQRLEVERERRGTHYTGRLPW